MSTIDKFLNKKYRFVKADENFDEYLKEIGSEKIIHCLEFF